MIKNEVLEIISINNGICDDCITTDGKFKRRQQVNKRCNKLFDEGSIYREKKVCEKCRKFKIISLISKLGESRLETMHEKKIDERSTNFETEDFGIFDLKFEFKWIPIIEEKSVEYLFPTPLDKLSKKKHSLPSVYRWILISPNGKKLQDVYIGEASELSRRIYNYLNPGERQKTNKRLNTLFIELIENGYNVTLQKLSFKPFKLGDFEINEKSLESKMVRRFIEHMMATYYLSAGYKLINA